MTEDTSDRKEYYQKIARAFLKHQPGIFFLSPRDLELISEWEKLNIPAEVVIEGIEKAFSRKISRRRKKNIYSLSQCEKEIIRAYAQHQERLVGRESPPPPEKSQKARQLIQQITACLENLPGEMSQLRPLLEEGLSVLKLEPVDEARLESLDEELDRRLWDLAREEEKQLYLQAAGKDYPGRPLSQLEEISRVNLARDRRQQYRIPHLALFYY